MYTKNKDIDKFKNYALGPISSCFKFLFICLQLPASVLEEICIDMQWYFTMVNKELFFFNKFA